MTALKNTTPPSQPGKKRIRSVDDMMAAFATAASELAREAAARQEELQRTVEDLESRQAEIDSFYHNVSHELKTPLTGAREFISIVHDGTAGPIATSQANLLGAALRNCDQMVRCLDDMLDSSRIQTGKLVLSMSEADLCAVVRDAADSLRGKAAERRVRMELKASGLLLPTTLDRHRIYQVVAVLVSNAIKHSPEGGRVVIRVKGEGVEALTVTVTDSGDGVPPGDEARVFDRLYGIESIQDAQHDGQHDALGMSLYISREIVELHGGTIEVWNEPEAGATFTLRVPRRGFLPMSERLKAKLSGQAPENPKTEPGAPPQGERRYGTDQGRAGDRDGRKWASAPP